MLEKLEATLSAFHAVNIANFYLPSSFVLAFLAGLFAVAAQTLYQLRCPKLVQSLSADDYIAGKINEYLAGPTETSLQEAVETVFRRGGLDIDEIRARLKRRESLEKAFQSSVMAAFQEQFRALRLSLDFYTDTRKITQEQIADARLGDDEWVRRREIDLIKRAAATLYLREVESRKLAVRFTAGLYLLTALFITWILVLQITRVFQAAGYVG